MDDQPAETLEKYSTENRGGSQWDVPFWYLVGDLGIDVLTDMLNVLRGLHFAYSTLQDPPSKKLKVGHRVSIHRVKSQLSIQRRSIYFAGQRRRGCGAVIAYVVN